MIHHSSSDPVLIKKISLKVWTLRDEIESKVQDKIASLGPEAEGQKIDVSDIQKEYDAKKPEAKVLSIAPAAELDNSEDEMKKAMEEMGQDTDVVLSPEEANTAEANVTPLFENANIIEISSDMPHIPEEKLSKGKTVLSEIGMERIFFFSNKKFTEGQSIVIKFEIPKTFIMHADVTYCRIFNLKSRVISQNNYQYRVMAKFSFLKDGERALLRQFLKSVEPEFEAAPPAQETAKTEKENDNDFSELDDLI